MAIIKFLAAMACSIYFIGTCLLAYGLVSQSIHFLLGLIACTISGAFLFGIVELYYFNNHR